MYKRKEIHIYIELYNYNDIIIYGYINSVAGNKLFLTVVPGKRHLVYLCKSQNYKLYSWNMIFI